MRLAGRDVLEDDEQEGIDARCVVNWIFPLFSVSPSFLLLLSYTKKSSVILRA
jgi:hypothetical protein